jgi:hypothetical protein
MLQSKGKKSSYELIFVDSCKVKIDSWLKSQLETNLESAWSRKIFGLVRMVGTSRVFGQTVFDSVLQR